MLQFPVLDGGKTVGQCTLLEDGLYWQIRCRCEEMMGVVRLYAGSRCVGVPEPAEGGLVLQRRVSRSGWPELPPKSGCFTLSPMEPWQGKAAGLSMPAGFCQKDGEMTTVRFPFSPDLPCPAMPLLCFFTLRDGFWQLKLDAFGMPVF